MAQYDVYPGSVGKGFLLDCQSALLAELETRVVVPLMPAAAMPVATRLNPIFQIEGEKFVMATQLIFAIPRARLTRPIDNLSREHDRIMSALDILWSGV